MRITWVLIWALIGLLTLGGHIALRNQASPGDQPDSQGPVYVPDCVSANGVIEGARPEVALRPEVNGTIATISFRENADVTQGTVLAELSNASLQQQVALAEAEVATAQAELQRLHNGERMEKRRAVAALERARRAQADQARRDWERVRKARSSISEELQDWTFYRQGWARAQWEHAQAELALVEAPARTDEVAAATGRVAAAEARRRLAQAELAKTRLTAPFSGRVLRVHAEPGEVAGPSSPQPLLRLADLSRRRVRAFIEELDASRVGAGQPARVTVDGLPGREFSGTVAVVMPRMGKRSLQTDAPEEYKDLYFREALIDLEGGDELVLNLRVKVRIKVR